MSDIEDIVAPIYEDSEALWVLLRSTSGRIAPHKWRRTSKARWYKQIDDTFTSDEAKHVSAEALYQALVRRYEDALIGHIDSRLVGHRDEFSTGYYVIPQIEEAHLAGNREFRYELEEEPVEAFEAPQGSEEPTVRLSGLLKAGSAAMALICGLSLLIWTLNGAIIVGPFAALLILAVTPFFYTMGSVIEERHRK